MPALHLFQRSNSDDSTLTIHSPITIAGLAVISLIVFGICLWLASRMYQKRAAAKRESRMGAAFLSVKGLVQENDSPSEKDGEKDGVLMSVHTSHRDKNDLNHDLVHPLSILDGRKH